MWKVVEIEGDFLPLSPPSKKTFPQLSTCFHNFPRYFSEFKKNKLFTFKILKRMNFVLVERGGKIYFRYYWLK